MSLSKYSNRELIRELIKRETFNGSVVHFSRPLEPSPSDSAQAVIAISKSLDRAKAARLLRAAVRTLEAHPSTPSAAIAPPHYDLGTAHVPSRSSVSESNASQ